MADLYKGIEGSPITYLAADISAGQTTISIADDTALPDAPNIATIGFGENVETIKYGQKSNGVLQEVVRGVEGIPRAWQAGTEVARFFTAYDHNSIIENFNAHLAESATQFSNINDVLQHYNTPQAVPYESGDNSWRDLSGIGFYYAGTSNVGYPSATGILIHFRLSSATTVTWQLFIGNAGQIWTRRVTSSANFANATWEQV